MHENFKLHSWFSWGSFFFWNRYSNRFWGRVGFFKGESFVGLTRLKINSVLDREWNIFFFQNISQILSRLSRIKNYFVTFQTYHNFKSLKDIPNLFNLLLCHKIFKHFKAFHSSQNMLQHVQFFPPKRVKTRQVFLRQNVSKHDDF